jgi:hypothetical protein
MYSPLFEVGSTAAVTPGMLVSAFVTTKFSGVLRSSDLSMTARVAAASPGEISPKFTPVGSVR